MSSNLDPRPDENQVLLALLQRLDEAPCLPSHLLEGYVADTLSAQEAEHVHAHLRQCVVCMAALARLQSMHADEPTPVPASADEPADPAPVAFRPRSAIVRSLLGTSPALDTVRAALERMSRWGTQA